MRIQDINGPINIIPMTIMRRKWKIKSKHNPDRDADHLRMYHPGCTPGTAQCVQSKSPNPLDQAGVGRRDRAFGLAAS